MPKDLSIKKVVVIGSGPIIIGQAAEFDYAGTQACKALREEGVEVVLLNSNPATIMTDDDIADKVYLQPITLDSLEYIIKREQPDGILATLGGQTGLNLVTEAYEKGILDKYNVKVLGTTVDAIQKAENRESFKKLMLEIGEPVPESAILNDVESAVKFADKIGYPIVVRPAYTLGGTGGGLANNEQELRSIAYKGLISSPINQVLVEKSVAGLKEIEYEVMRDANDTVISICNMENVDPIGIHTGDSIVIAPSQTLNDKEYQKLRSVSLKIIRALKIAGGCNIQFALNSENGEYYVIEVNPRVSRSSALASKATGYPIARITAKIAIGLNLNEIKNTVTGKTTAAFEPVLDYVVLKIPKWPFDKFSYADRLLGTQMKATGEVMSIDRTFERALMKAVISLEQKGFVCDKFAKLTEKELKEKLKKADDERLFVIAEALRKNISAHEISEITKIDRWFILKIQNIVEREKELKTNELTADLLKKAKLTGFTDEEISMLTGRKISEIKDLKKKNNLYPIFKIVDTCAAEFEAESPYYYSTYEDYDENSISENKKVIVIGSGPIRIGQGIEFDYCSVQAVQGIKNNGCDAIIINNNPETVSTDFDISDKLYFEPLDIEDVENIVKKENPEGIILQFGGQTSLNIAPKLSDDIRVLGTSINSINLAEDREKFEEFLKELNIKQPKSLAITSVDEAKEGAEKIGYPVLLRPSYVTGGMSMKNARNEKELISFVKEAVKISPEYPVAMDKFILGKEFEADILSDGEDILIPGFMEHIERAGVHSGDSFCSYPPQTLSDKVIKKALEYSEKIAKALKVKGLLNIQFIAEGDDVYVIEVNPRASRTVPMMSKVTKIPMVKTAVNLIFGQKLKEQGFGMGIFKQTNLVAVKAPVFSFQKLAGTDVGLCTEMKSTGEVLGIDNVFEKALAKAFISSGIKLLNKGNVLVSAEQNDENLQIIQKLVKNGFEIVTTKENKDFFDKNKINTKILGDDYISEIKTGGINIVFSMPYAEENKNLSKIREVSYLYGIPCFTRPETIEAYLSAIEYRKNHPTLDYKTIEEYMK